MYPTDPSAKLYKLYRTKRWRQIRERIAREDPYCTLCQREGVKRLWEEVDHVVPHGGDLDLFWDEANLQGLCRPHHALKTRFGQ